MAEITAIDTLLKYLNATNVAEFLNEEQCKQIASDVITGYEIDEHSRQQWLIVNKEAMSIIKNAENNINSPRKDFPFANSCKVVYPLITPAAIQLSSRLITQLVHNDTVGECQVLGQDQPAINPQTGQPTGMGVKATKAKNVGDYLNYKHLTESDTWLTDQHKFCMILATWGMAFQKKYWDPVLKDVCTEVLAPEDVIINHDVTCLDKAPRITIRRYLSENEIISKQRSKQFSEDLDIDMLDANKIDNSFIMNDSRDKQPVYEILEQYCWLDLDGDKFKEPYCVYVAHSSKQVCGIYPAFEYADINITPKGEIINIKWRPYIVDCGLIDDPEGKYYKLGLNHILIQQNKALTSIERQIIDAGTLSNTAGVTGFVTKAFKSKERSLRYRMGELKQIDIPMGTRISDHISNLPFREPSQVLFQMLEFLSASGDKMGFITDVLTGDVEMQNVPATTALAMVEQGSRAFKPVIQKMQQAQKKGFKMWFHLNALYMDRAQYIKFKGDAVTVSQDDFDESNLDICPVADPNASSEAHEYAKLRAQHELFQAFPQLVTPAWATQYLTKLGCDNAEQLVAQPQPPQPDPDKVMQVQLKAKIADDHHTISLLKEQNQVLKLQLAHDKENNKSAQFSVNAAESHAKIKKMSVDAHNDAISVINQSKMTDIEKQNADTESRRVEILAKQSRDKANSPGSSF